MKLMIALLIGLSFFAGQAQAQAKTDKADEKGFVQLFDGKTLNGWKLVRGHGPGYVIKDNTIVRPKDGGGNLYVEKEYANFIFRFEFKTEPSEQLGVGIRAPYEGDAAYQAWKSKSWMTATKCTKARSNPNSITARFTM